MSNGTKGLTALVLLATLATPALADGIIEGTGRAVGAVIEGTGRGVGAVVRGTGDALTGDDNTVVVRERPRTVVVDQDPVIVERPVVIEESPDVIVDDDPTIVVR